MKPSTHRKAPMSFLEAPKLKHSSYQKIQNLYSQTRHVRDFTYTLQIFKHSLCLLNCIRPLKSMRGHKKVQDH